MARVDIELLKKVKDKNMTTNSMEIIDEIDEYLGSKTIMSYSAKKNYCKLLKYEDENIITPEGKIISETLVERIKQ